jgi:hypothetical protein
MSVFSLLDCTAWVSGYDFTTDSNKLTIETSAEELDATTFGGGGWKAVAGGLKSVSGSLEGLWQGAPDAQGFGELGVFDRVVTVSPTGEAGSTAYMFQATQLKYSAFGNVGDLTPFSLDLSGSNTAGVVRGQIALTPNEVTETGPVGSVVNLGAVSGDQFVYATLHAFGTPGTTLSVKVESASDAAFTTPHDVQAFSVITASGGSWMLRKSGPTTDTYFRFNVTAITGSFTLAGAIAVQ